MHFFNKTLSGQSQRFKDAAIERCQNKAPNTTKSANVSEAFFAIYKDEPLMKRLALSWAYALKKEPVYLFDNELLVGQHYRGEAGAAGYSRDKQWGDNDGFPEYFFRLKKEIPEVFPILGYESADAEITPNSWMDTSYARYVCSPGHIGWHWDWILSSGVTGLFKRIENAFPNVDAKGQQVLEAMKISLQGLLDMNSEHVKALEAKCCNSNKESITSLKEKIEICKQVPLHGARNFREAVQAFHISYLATMFENPYGGNGPGRLDYYLWPYLEKDLKSGKETLESARLLIDELFIRFHERYKWGCDGAVETIVVAGSHPDGSSAANPLSKIIVESIVALNITHPAVYIRIPGSPPQWLIDLAVADLLEGNNRAQILNDEAIVEAMMLDGHINKEDAYMYMCGGCMEISPHGKNGDLLFTGFFNIGKVLEYVLTGGECLINQKKMMKHLEKNLSDFTTFDELYNSFIMELKRCLQVTFKKMDICSEYWSKYRPSFLVSSQVEDCIKRGRIINDGGAVYEDFGQTPLGIPNVGDALYAIKKAVFDEKFISGVELLDILRKNFEGHDILRQRLSAIPKFGQGDTNADAITNNILTDLCNIYAAHTNRLGGKVKPMIMTFHMSPIIGDTLGATADGRLSGKPIAHGVTPQSNSMHKGITTAMLSATNLDLKLFSGGASHMWDLDRSFATPEITETLVKTFFKLGGQMFQGNKIDTEILKKARENPDEYKNFIVRVGGFSAKFTALSEATQDELINRIKHQK